MKKLISLLLSAALLCTLMLSMSSCGLGKVNVRMTVKDYGVPISSGLYWRIIPLPVCW